MTEFHIEVVRIGAVERLPNSDSLSITQVHGGYPVIFRTGDFHEGDLAVYIPVDAMVPTDRVPFEFLAVKDHGVMQRIKARRLRGTFSMGLLVPAPPMTKEGDDVRLELGVEKYEAPEDKEGEPEGRKPPTKGSWPWWRVWLSKYCPWLVPAKRPTGPKVPVYDIEGLRKYKNLLRGPVFIDHVLVRPGEDVVITEKIHGQSSRYAFVPSKHWWQRGHFFAGSRTLWGREKSDNNWSKIAAKYGLEKVCRANPNLIIYGEIYGDGVQKGFSYGKVAGIMSFMVFDIYDLENQCFLGWPTVRAFCVAHDLLTVPELYRGPWSLDLVNLAEGQSTMAGALHVREGVVIKPLHERIDPQFGRVILKLHGEGYLLGKLEKKK